MADETHETDERCTKLPSLYSALFLTNSSFPGCLEYSRDSHFSLVNNNSIYIFMLKSLLPDLTSPFRFAISVLPNPKEEKFFDVGINSDVFCVQANRLNEAHSFVLDSSLNPNRANLMPPAFACAKWSPTQCTYDGRSLLCSLSVNNHVYINGAEECTGKWKPLVDLAEILNKDLKNNLYKDVETIGSKENKVEPLSNLSQEFEVYKRRHYYSALTAFCWCPVSLETANEVSPTRRMHFSICGSNPGQNASVLLLSTANKLGWLFIWKISITGMADEIDAKVLNAVKFDSQFPAAITWYQEQSSTKGYIAMSFSNGHIKICTVDTTITETTSNCKTLGVYDLWIEDDSMIPKFMEWMKKDGKLRLVVTKMSYILIFTLKMDEMSVIKSHSYECAPSLHDLPITALSCRGNLIATAGVDGIIQHFKIGDNASHLISNKCQDGYSCLGMQLSHDGLMMIKMLCPTAMLFVQGRYTKETEITIIPILPLEDAANKFVDPCQHLTLEFCEYFRASTAHQEIPDVLMKFCTTEIGSQMSTMELQKIDFLQRLIELKESLKSTELQSVYSQSLCQRPIVQQIKERWYRKMLKEALRMLEDDSNLDKPDKEFVLLAADWLVTKGRMSDSLQIATSIYKALGDSESHDTANLVWLRRNDSNKAVDGIGNVKSDKIKPEDLYMPCREQCPICKRNIGFESEEFGECEKKHKWRRCFLTGRIMSDSRNRTCVCCGVTVSCKQLTPPEPQLKLINKIVNMNKCITCNGNFMVLS